jgi:hypothetical protein
MRFIQTANRYAEQHVISRVYSIAIVIFTVAVALPSAINAQQAARIRATARVVGSVLPETQAVTESRLENLTQSDIGPDAAMRSPIMSSRGFAHVFTEPLFDKPDYSNTQAGRERVSAKKRHQTVLQITVAYTAN